MLERIQDESVIKRFNNKKRSIMISIAEIPPTECYRIHKLYHTLSDNILAMINVQFSPHKQTLYYDPLLRQDSIYYSHTQTVVTDDIDKSHDFMQKCLETQQRLLSFLKRTIDSQFKHIDRDYIMRGEGYSSKEIEFKKIVGYNVYKEREQYKFILGWNKLPSERYATLLGSIRGWNITRLKVQNITLTEKNLAVVIEHLIIIAREFSCSNKLQYNAHKSTIKNMLNYLSQADNIFRTSLQDSNILRLKYKINQYTITYKQLTHRTLWSILSQIIYNELGLIFLTRSYSIGMQVKSNASELQITIITIHDRATVCLLESDKIDESVEKMIIFMSKKAIQSLSSRDVDSAQSLFNNSLSVFKKYDPSQGNSYHLSAKLSYNPSAKKIKRNNTNLSSESDNKYLIQSSKQQELCGVVERHNVIHGLILPASELCTLLSDNTSKAHSFPCTETTGLLKALGALRYFLSKEDMLNMLYQSYGQSNNLSATEQPLVNNSLLYVLRQAGNQKYLIELGMQIAAKSIQFIYEAYIYNNSIRRYLLVSVMKIIMQIHQHGEQPTDPKGKEKVPIPVILYLLEHQDYKSEEYQRVIREVMPEIFEAGWLLSGLLKKCYSILKSSHHSELILTLLATLLHQVVCFSHELPQMNLTNQIYLDLKKKKMHSLIRAGGFKGMGHFIAPLLQRYLSQPLHLSDPHIFELITISSLVAQQLINFLKTVLITQPLNKVVKYFNLIDKFQPQMQCVFYTPHLQQFDFNIHMDGYTIFSDKSESGIFEQLMQYNPQIRIAGQPIKQKHKHQLPSYKEVVENIFNGVAPSEVYEHIQLSLLLKERQAVTADKSRILSYLQIDALIKFQRIHPHLILF